MTSKKEKKVKYSFWNDVRTGKVSKVAARKRLVSILGMIFRYMLLISLGFVIVTPLLKLLKEAVTDHNLLGLKNSVWIPQAISDVSFVIGSTILKFWKALIYSLSNTAVIMVLQVFSAALAAYSFARLKFKGSNLLFALVLFTIIVPSQSIMLAQYITFRNFDVLGIFKLFTGKPISLIGNNLSLYLLAITGMGVKGGLFIYILRQNFRQLPISIGEAAYVDGAGFLKTFFRIVLPSSSASLTTVAVLSFLWNYTDVYFISLLSNHPLNLALRFSQIQANMRWPIKDTEKLLSAAYVTLPDSPLVQSAVAAACALLVIIPLLILYLFVQKRFVQGVERSGLGGD